MPLHTVAMLGAMVWTFAAQAAVPAFIPYSGRLSDGTAWGQSTTLDLTLTLYDAEVGGAVVFQGKHQDAQVVDGYFTVNLGMCDQNAYCVTNPVDASFPATLPDALWLGVTVDDRPELPRVPVGATPYSVRAGEADHVAGLDLAGLDGRFVQEGQEDGVTSTMLADGTVATADLANGAVTDAKLAEGAVTLDAIAPNGCQPGQTLRWTGLAWVCEDMLSKVEAETQFAFVTAPCPSDMVLVGDFCVDRYEASVWERKDGGPVDCAALQAAVDEAIAAGWTESEIYSGTGPSCTSSPLGMCEYRQYGSPFGCASSACDDYPTAWPDSGNWVKKLTGCAIGGVKPSRSLTWLQAQQACGASGRHLVTNGEWQLAVAGTPDPGSNNGVDGSCNTSSSDARRTGKAAGKCVSKWGVEDMIGNLWEWADLWGQAGRDMSIEQGKYQTPWPKAYTSGTSTEDCSGGACDGTWNVNGEADGPGWTSGLPFAAIRGGSWQYEAKAGAFAFYAANGPSRWDWSLGFRCSKNAGGLSSPTLVADNAVTSAKVVDGTLALADLGASGCSDGQMPKWDEGGSKWVCANDLGGVGLPYEAGEGLDLVGTTFQVNSDGIASVLPAWDQDASDDLTRADLATTLDDRFVNTSGDEMTGPLRLPENGLAIGATQLVAANGNVGVGTKTPTSPLEVVGRAHVLTTGTTEDDGLSVGSSFSGVAAGGTGRLKLWYTSGSGVAPKGYIDVKQGGTSYASSSLALLPNGGNVGVGTTGPEKTLDVAGDARVSGTLFAGCQRVVGAKSPEGTNVVTVQALCPTGSVVLGGGPECVGVQKFLDSYPMEGLAGWQAVVFRDTTAWCRAYAVCCRFGN